MYLLTILHLATRIADYQRKTKRREKKISFKHNQDLAAIKRPELLKQEEEQRVRNAENTSRRIKKLARNLPHTAPLVGDDDYKKLKRKLDHHFLPKKNKQHADTCLTNKSKSKERVLSHTQRDCAKSHRIANSASKQKTEYWNT